MSRQWERDMACSSSFARLHISTRDASSEQLFLVHERCGCNMCYRSYVCAKCFNCDGVQVLNIVNFAEAKFLGDNPRLANAQVMVHLSSHVPVRTSPFASTIKWCGAACFARRIGSLLTE